jgi:hypothetical protein
VKEFSNVMFTQAVGSRILFFAKMDKVQWQWDFSGITENIFRRRSALKKYSKSPGTQCYSLGLSRQGVVLKENMRNRDLLRRNPENGRAWWYRLF